MEDRLKSIVDYKTVNSRGVVTILIHAEVADQSYKAASMFLIALKDGLSKIPESQITK